MGNIKTALLDTIDRFHKLALEAEVESVWKGDGDAGCTASANKSAAVALDYKLSDKLDDESRLLLENNKKLQALQEHFTR